MTKCVTCANRDGERVAAGLSDEVDSLVGVGQKLLARELAFGAHAVLFPRLTGLKAAENAEFSLDGHAYGVRELADTLGDLDVVRVAGGRLGVGK
jgi:hypothetical protein